MLLQLASPPIEELSFRSPCNGNGDCNGMPPAEVELLDFDTTWVSEQSPEESAPTRRLTRGDLNACFGFGSNLLLNLIVLSGLLLEVLALPLDLVYGEILPATGLMMFLSSLLYAGLALYLSRKSGTDFCALPSGISVPHMFVVVYVVMLPVLVETGHPESAWGAGLVWVAFQSVFLLCAILFTPLLRRLPRSALLATLAGVSLSFISLRPFLQIFSSPLLGLPSLLLLLLGFFGRYKFPFGAPVSLVAVGLPLLVSLVTRAVDVNSATEFVFGPMSVSSLDNLTAPLGFHLPMPHFAVLASGLPFFPRIVVSAIPFGLYDYLEIVDNIESAASAGDPYPTWLVLVLDSIVSALGALFGTPFMNVVYIGHPGWKRLGGRWTYAPGAGVFALFLTLFGLVGVLEALIPLPALAPILLYVGLLIGSQAFQESSRSHAPAILLGLLPQIAAWTRQQIDQALVELSTARPEANLSVSQLADYSPLYRSLRLLGSGAVLTSMLLSALFVLLLEGRLRAAATVAAVASVLTLFGLMHAEEVGLFLAPSLALSYLVLAALLAFLPVCLRRDSELEEED